MHLKLHHPRRWLTSLALAAAVLCIIASSLGAPTTQPAVVNPHWTRLGCATCHDMSSGKAAPIALNQTDALCLKCHDGQRARAEPHPTRRVFRSNEQYVRPEGWPVVNEEIRCVTCHDMPFACDLTAHTPAMNRYFLRGAPEVRGQAFCLNCHQEPAHKKINPHLMLGTDADADAHCLVCHSKVLDRATTRPTGNPFLKAEQTTLCRDCHQGHKNPMTQNHIGLHLDEEQLAFMFAKDVLGLSSNPTKEFLHAAADARARPRLLLPAKDDTITCSTCHNPHEEGLFAENSPVAYGALRLDHQNKLVSPVRETGWCRHCHAM